MAAQIQAVKSAKPNNAVSGHANVVKGSACSQSLIFQIIESMILAVYFALAGGARFLIQCRVAGQNLPAIALHRPQIQGDLALRLQRGDPSQGYADDDALVEAALAELLG